jgi:hypothetical protein
MLDKEFSYYINNQAELVAKYNGKVLVIIGEEVVAVCDDFESAVYLAKDKWELGTYLIQECSPGEESYTQTFHSRAIFA